MKTPRIDRLDRNFLINGNFHYAQYMPQGQDIVAASPEYYVFDRWLLDAVNENVSAIRFLDVPSGSKSKYSCSLGDSTAITSAATEMRLAQRVESIFARDLINEKASLNFYYKSGSATELEVIVSLADVEDDFTAITTLFTETVTIPADSTFYEYKKEDISFGSVGNGIQVEIRFKNMSNTGGSFAHRIADVKLGLGTTAQEFSLMGKDLREEFALLQRYFEKTYNPEVAPGTVDDSGANFFMSNNIGRWGEQGQFKEMKGRIPVCQVYSPVTGVAGSIRDISNVTDRTAVVQYEGLWSFSARYNATTGGADCALHWTAKAEL